MSYDREVIMKIEIDLDTIFADENTISESVAERIERAIIKHACDTTQKLVDTTFSTVITEKVNGIVDSKIAELLEDLLDHEYTPVDRWGERGETTTLRKKIYTCIEQVLTWKNSNYSSEQSVFTKTVRSIVESKLGEFKKQFDKTVDEQLIADSMQYALNKIRNTTRK